MSKQTVEKINTQERTLSMVRWALCQAVEDKAFMVEALGGDATQLRRLAVELGEAAIRAGRS